MRRKLILVCPHSGEEMVLPVTPEQYRIGHGQHIEVVNIHQVGDLHLAGTTTLCTITLDLLLPTGPRSYTNAPLYEPEWYLWHLRQWVDEKTLLRFVVGGTYINLPVLIEDFQTGEGDGTNDVFCTLVLREYRQTGQAGGARGQDVPPATPRSYTVQKGDTLSGICRSAYGDGSLYPALAAYNAIPNPDLIYPGTVLRLPDKNQL